jgi:hypothetical protein
MDSNVICGYFHNKQVNFHVGALHRIAISTAYSTLSMYIIVCVCVLIFLKGDTKLMFTHPFNVGHKSTEYELWLSRSVQETRPVGYANYLHPVNLTSTSGQLILSAPQFSICINLGILLQHTQALSLCKVSPYHDLQSASGHMFLISSFVTPSLSHKPHCIDLHWYLNIRCFKSPFKNTSTHMHFIQSFIMILTNKRKIVYYKNIHK